MINEETNWVELVLSLTADDMTDEMLAQYLKNCEKEKGALIE